MDDLLSTPAARAGPTSRLLRRQSAGLGAPAAPRTPSHRLDASLRQLDAALGSPIPPAEHYVTEDVTRLLEVTRPDPRATRGDYTMAAEVTMPFSLEQSVMLGEESPGVAATENLFEDFLSTLSGGAGGASALDSIAELEQMVSAYCWLCYSTSEGSDKTCGFVRAV